jgi:hypothetical protein
VAAKACAAKAAPHSNAAAMDALNRRHASAAHNIFFMTNLPTVMQKRLRDFDCGASRLTDIPSRL